VNAHISCIRLGTWFATMAVLFVAGIVSPGFAQQACNPSEQHVIAAAIEACVQMLREEPASSSHRETVHPAVDALGVGTSFFIASENLSDYTEYNVGDAKFAAAFTKCIRKANPDYTGSDSVNVSLPVVRGEQSSAGRYQYTNKYQQHQLRDTQRKVIYTLIRVPEGGIESMGTWVSDKPGSYDASSGCKNSYGDPCGTKYRRTIAGSYESL
jgi:hypothetical protein